jgi:hypothetical protein
MKIIPMPQQNEANRIGVHSIKDGYGAGIIRYQQRLLRNGPS